MIVRTLAANDIRPAKIRADCSYQVVLLNYAAFCASSSLTSTFAFFASACRPDSLFLRFSMLPDVAIGVALTLFARDAGPQFACGLIW